MSSDGEWMWSGQQYAFYARRIELFQHLFAIRRPPHLLHGGLQQSRPMLGDLSKWLKWFVKLETRMRCDLLFRGEPNMLKLGFGSRVARRVSEHRGHLCLCTV